MSIAVETGTRITGLAGPIPNGCVIFSKTRFGEEGNGSGYTLELRIGWGRSGRRGSECGY